MDRIPLFLLASLALPGCTDDTSEADDAQETSGLEGASNTNEATGNDETGNPSGGETDTSDDTEPPLELRPTLCDDASNMDALRASPQWNNLLSSGGFNEEQVQRMVAAPTDGPFYMFNLIRYREWADYPDGRETDLTGREANALYNPSELIAAIGAGVVFNTEVDNQIDGEDIQWDTVAIVEYPCPVAFFAMLVHPDFQERSIHKSAGVERTIVLVTDRIASLPPNDPDQSEAEYPPTPDDPAFDLIHVMDFHEIAQYGPDANEPERTGEEAWEEYQKAGSGASASLGHYLTGGFKVQGVLLGDQRSWDEIQIVRMSSQQGFQALLDDPTREAGRYHRAAALAHNYSMITFPSLSNLSGDEDEPTMLPVTPDGTGTVCQTDADCPGGGVETCLTDGNGGQGFCTREGCGAGTCESPYLCCHDCAEASTKALPFENSACLPEALSPNLTGPPVSCTCD